MKDSYAREKRRLSSVKSGSATVRKSPYIYFKFLTFLTTNTPPTNTHSNIPTDDPDETQIELEVQPTMEPTTSRAPFETRVLAKKRKPQDDVGQQLIKVLKDSAEDRRKRENDVLLDEDKLFMLSLVNDFKKVPDELKLSVKRQFLNILEQNQPRKTSDINTRQYQGQQNYQFNTYPSYNQQYSQGGNNFQFTSRESTSTPRSTPSSEDYGVDNSASILSCFNNDSH